MDRDTPIAVRTANTGIYFKSTILILLTNFVCIQSNSFNADRECPTQGVIIDCHCTPDVIECFNRGLLNVPSFTRTSWTFRNLDLSKNNITNINDRAFDNVNVTEINLSDNAISTIHIENFFTLKKQLYRLDLKNNKLQQIPPVLALLDKLTILDVSYNPLPQTGFTDDVMRRIGDFLQEFRFGDPTLKEWPDTLHHFQDLRILKFYGGTMDRIPITAFAGFEWTLKTLWMQNTKLIAVPLAMYYLNSVDELHFDNNVFMTDDGILSPAFAGISTTLHTLTLENNGLSTFPAVLKTLTSLQNLSLARNNLQVVNDNTVSVVGSNITILNLQGCNLARIPEALSKLDNLLDLDVSYNRIITIEKNDLQAMSQLRKLTLSHNPLYYISKFSFLNQTRLESLVVQNISLHEVPEAVKNLPQLTILDLRNRTSTIDCNCDLTWLHCFMKNNNTKLRILGECCNIHDTIDQYVKIDLPIQCPVNWSTNLISINNMYQCKIVPRQC